jgi:multidrug resistance efflux pump
MTQPPVPPHPDDRDQDLTAAEAAIATLEAQFAALKDRIAQLRTDRDRVAAIEARRDRVAAAKTPGWKTELRHLEAELGAIEANLESRLLSWHSFREPFWHIVRWGGGGLVLGWWLHSWLQ